MAVLQQATTKIKKFADSLSTPLPVVEINFNKRDERNYGSVKLHDLLAPDTVNEPNEDVPIHCPGDKISGTMDILFIEGMKEFEFEEISVSFIGEIRCPQIRKHYIFCTQKLSLTAGPGKLYSSTQFDFSFSKIECQHASFYGSIITCKYYIKAVVKRPGNNIFKKNSITNQQYIMIIKPIINPKDYPKESPLDLQVGVDNCLHIKFSYTNINLSTDGCLEGCVKILQNTLKITTMQIQFLRREVVTTGNSPKPELSNTEVLGRFELMDGEPSDDEYIPVRMHLSKFKSIGPTMSTRFFDIKYYVNLGLIDKDGRRYFKTVEIKLWSKQPKIQ